VRQRPFVLEHLAEITAIDPPIAGGAPDEMLGLQRPISSLASAVRYGATGYAPTRAAALAGELAQQH
jgi:hypothetical protein